MSYPSCFISLCVIATLPSWLITNQDRAAIAGRCKPGTLIMQPSSLGPQASRLIGAPPGAMISQSVQLHTCCSRCAGETPAVPVRSLNGVLRAKTPPEDCSRRRPGFPHALFALMLGNNCLVSHRVLRVQRFSQAPEVGVETHEAGRALEECLSTRLAGQSVK